MPLPTGIVQKPQINAVIDIVIRQLSPDVKRIFFEVGPDWSGDEAVFFRILISDDAAEFRLRETTQKAVGMLESFLNPETMGLRVYHNVRSVSEQEALREKSWE
jgi:hypothetical protein